MKIDINDLRKVKGIGDKTIRRIIEELTRKPEVERIVKNFNPTSIGDIDLYKGNALEVMDYLISKGVVVDAIITDPPYGTTACKWDSVIPFDEMWERLNKLIKPNGAIVMTSSQPFTSSLVMSNIEMFKYCWVWEKQQGTNPMLAKIHPLKVHEDVCVFYKEQSTYNPQMTFSSPYSGFSSKTSTTGEVMGKSKSIHRDNPTGSRYPRSIQKFNTERIRGGHPTQKPVSLMEYLIKTYTNEGETVLDFTMGSGTTLVGCKNLNRKGIGIELDDKYFNIAVNRIKSE